MSEIYVFTSAAFNYIPKVRMLFHSLRKHHPEWKLHLLLADELRPDINLSQEPFDEVVAASELDIPGWPGWAYCHSIVELATAIKPFMLDRLLRQPGCKKVIYLDPDTVVFSPLNDVVTALDHANIVLTPHQTSPEKSLSAIMDNEISSLKHGIYNLGFVAVAATETGLDFANWWSQRLYSFCREDIANGLFTDQRWIDLVPAFFSGVAILRSSRHNVATWNLTTRQMTLSSTGDYLVDGEPLGFYHFTGFDSGAHRLMAAKHAGHNTAVSNLIDWYAEQVDRISNDPLAKIPWAYNIHSDGTIILKEQRVVYRERADLQQRFPDPFDAATYLDWWNKQGPEEFPGLFDGITHDSALTELASALSPGYRGEDRGLDWAKLRGMVQQTLRNPKAGLEISRAGWEILRNEGIRGVKKRFLV